MTPDASVYPSRRLVWPVLKPVGSDLDNPSVRINRLTCVVGDRSQVHLPLHSPLVSRAHALIVVDEGEVYIRDLASRNRLFVNGWAVNEVSLRPADLLQIGPFRFRCYAGFTQRRGEESERVWQAELIGGSGGLDAGRRLSPTSRTVLIGRRDECDLVLASPAASSVHAVIFRRGGDHFVRDLNSRTGTIVNGRRVRESKLKDGDELAIATAAWRFERTKLAATDDAPLSARGRAAEDSWCETEAWSSASHALSASRSIGAETMKSADIEREPTSPAAAGLLDLGDAAPEDFGFESHISMPPVSALKMEAELGLATAAELFPTETSLSTRRALPAVNRNPVPPRNNGNGNGKH